MHDTVSLAEMRRHVSGMAKVMAQLAKLRSKESSTCVPGVDDMTLMIT